MKNQNNWPQVKLKNIALRIIGGGTPSTSKAEYWNGEIAWTTSAHLTGREIQTGQKYITKKGLLESSTCIVPKQNILIATRVGIGKVAINKIDIAISQDLTGILIDKKIVMSEYLYWALTRKKNKLKALAQGSTIKGILRKDVAKIQIPLPPLPEQKKIAEILTTVDLAIKKSNDAIKKINELRKGLASKLFSQGIGHQKFKKTILGKIPYEWEIQKLDSLLELCQYGLSIKMESSGEFPIIKMNSIKNGRVIHENLRYVNLNRTEFQKYKLKKGDILFNRTNSYELVGRTGVFTLEGDYVFASYLIRLRVIDKQISSYFLALYLIFKNNQLRQMATRAVHQANINATNLKGFSVLVPSLKEQKEITEIFNSIDKKMELLQAKKEKLSNIKKGLMNDLLTGQKRVRLES